MGAIWLTRLELITTTSELVGYKSGLALTRGQLARFIPAHHRDVWSGRGESILRIRSEEFEDIVDAVLHGVGAIRKRGVLLPGVGLFHEHRGDPAKLKIAEGVHQLFIEFMKDGVERAVAEGSKLLDPTHFLERSAELYGRVGLQMADEMLEELEIWQTRQPWTDFRRVEWNDTLELEDLFKSESLEASYGRFVDQRFIDYLASNFGDIDKMNWRKFEGLTGEFFDRAGYHVELGKGRADGGIDARIWPRKEDASSPPAILVQCKRQKDKVQTVIVKALYSDIVEEQAQSGLIVTTSSLSPDAKRTCTARGYPIGRVGRKNLRAWIESMRTPGTGVFLGQ